MNVTHEKSHEIHYEPQTFRRHFDLLFRLRSKSLRCAGSDHQLSFAHFNMLTFNFFFRLNIRIFSLARSLMHSVAIWLSVNTDATGNLLKVSSANPIMEVLNSLLLVGFFLTR